MIDLQSFRVLTSIGFLLLTSIQMAGKYWYYEDC